MGCKEDLDNQVTCVPVACFLVLLFLAGCRQVAISDYFIKEKNCLQSNEVLVGIEIPFTDQVQQQNSFFLLSGHTRSFCVNFSLLLCGIFIEHSICEL